MGHNDMDYTKTPAPRISGQFESPYESEFITRCIYYLLDIK